MGSLDKGCSHQPSIVTSLRFAESKKDFTTLHRTMPYWYNLCNPDKPSFSSKVAAVCMEKGKTLDLSGD